MQAACEEWLRWIEIDRKRRPSTVSDYRQEVRRLLAEFGSATPIAEISSERIDAWRRRAVAEGRLSERTINKRRQQLHAIFKRSQRLYGLPANPVAEVDRQPDHHSGDFQVIDPHQVEMLVAQALGEQDGVLLA